MISLLLLQLISAQSIPFLELPSPPVSGNYLSPNLISYYRMETSTGPQDSIGTRTLTQSGSSLVGSGRVDFGKPFGGSTYFWMADDDAFDPGTGPFTIMFWVKFVMGVPTSVDGAVTIVGKWNYQGIGTWLINTSNSGVTDDPYRYSISCNIMYPNEVTPLNYPVIYYPAIPNNVWYCIGMRLTGNAGGSTVNINVRTELDTSWTRDYQNVDVSGLMNSDAPITFSGLRDKATQAQAVNSRLTINSRIDEVGIWNRYLSDCEMDQFYNAGLGLSLSRYNSLPCQ